MEEACAKRAGGLLLYITSGFLVRGGVIHGGGWQSQGEMAIKRNEIDLHDEEEKKMTTNGRVTLPLTGIGPNRKSAANRVWGHSIRILYRNTGGWKH